MTKNLVRSRIEYTSYDWVPVLLPKVVVQELLKQGLARPTDKKSYFAVLEQLQRKVKNLKLFEGMSASQIMNKLHKTRKRLLREDPHAYINYNS